MTALALLLAAGCSSSKAPPPAITPGGSTTTIGAAGGRLAVATPEGATLQLEVPAGALARDVVITTSAQPAGAGEQFRVAFDPPGVAFKVPATLTVTLPGGAFPADATLTAVAAGTGRRTWFPAAVSGDGRTLTASLSVLGAPTATSAPGGLAGRTAAAGRAAVTSADGQGFLLVAAAMPTGQLLAQLQGYVQQLLADARFEDAVTLSLGARVMIDRLGTDTTGWAAPEQQFWDDLRSAVCSGQLATVTRADAVQPQCLWQSREPAKDLLGAQALSQQLGVTCGDGESNPTLSALHGLLQRTITFIQDPAHRQAFVACECNDPVRLAAEQAGTRRRPPECGAPLAGRVAAPASARVSPVSLASAFDRTTAGYEWKLLLETVTLTADEFSPLYAIDYTSDADRATSTLAGGTVDVVRRHAFALCLDNQDSSILEALWRRVAQLEAPLSDVTSSIQADAQHCGASLHVVAQKADQSEAATVDIARPTGPGQPAPEGSIIAPADGKLFLTGPIATLRCRDPGTMEQITLAADELTFTSESGAIRHTIGGVLARGHDDVLPTSPAVVVNTAFELGALNLNAQDSQFDVIVERQGGGCGFDAPASAEVLRLHVSTDLPVTLTLGGVNDHFPGDPPRTGSVGVVPGNGALLVAKLLRGDVPMRDKKVTYRKHDYATGTATDVDAPNTDIYGMATVAVPRPAEGSSDFYYAFWSQDGRDCPNPYLGGSPPPWQCQVSIITVQPTVAVTVSGCYSGVDKGGTCQFSAVLNAGTSQGVNWSVSGLGSISETGLFTAGQEAGEFTVTATSAASASLTGSTTGHVKFTNVDYVGTWSGTQVVLWDQTQFGTDVDGSTYVAGYKPASNCTGATAGLGVTEGPNSSGAGVGQLGIHYNDLCSGGMLAGTSSDRSLNANQGPGPCQTALHAFQTTKVDGVMRMHGTFTLYSQNCLTWITREFNFTK